MIPLASPLAQYLAYKPAIRAAIDRVLESGAYILGNEVSVFENAFASYLDTAHAVGVGNGTDALILALKAMDIGPGDEVITVSHTAVATVAAVIAAGATPVLVDIDPVFYTIDPEKIEAAITSRTKAVIAVHIYGQCADIDAIAACTARHDLKLIEDCAQATGARYKGRCAGTIGDAGCFSFYPTKNLGGIGDGGMVVTANAELADRIRRLRQYGWDETRTAHGVGVNSRLDPLQAAILGELLPHLDTDNSRRAEIAKRYSAAFADLPFGTPNVRPDTDHVFHLYVVTADDRDGVMTKLSEAGVGSAVHYYPAVHEQDSYAQAVVLPSGGLPVTTQLTRRIVSLPMFPALSNDDVERVIKRVCALWTAYTRSKGAV